MEKTLSLLLAIIMLFSFVTTATSCSGSDTIACPSCGEENSNTVKFCSNCGERLEMKTDDDKEESDSEKEDDSEKVAEKSAKQKLCEYIKENGANYQGTYKTIELSEDGYFSMSCTPQDELVFLWNHEYNNQTTYIKLNFYEASVTQTVTYQYELSGYTCVATGTIYTNLISPEECQVYGVSYRDDFPSSVSSQLDALIDSTFPLSVKSMLMQLNLVLLKYTDVTMSDLGFTNWRNDN